MIDILFEQRVIQNTGLAAETIWQAVHEAYNAKRRAEGVPFPLIFLVLPLAFHQHTRPRSRPRLSRERYTRRLRMIVRLPLGLQARMEAWPTVRSKRCPSHFKLGCSILTHGLCANCPGQENSSRNACNG